MEDSRLSASRIVRFLFVHCFFCRQEPTWTHCVSAWWKSYLSRERKVLTFMMPSNSKTW